MNHEQDLLGRLVDYHDHISAPTVPLADDLHRGRRRVRRNRGLVTGGVALGVASIAVVVSLATGDRSSDGPQPVGPSGLNTPLLEPASPLDVRELGFHVEPVPGVAPNQDWNVAPDFQVTTLDWAGHALIVRVHYPAAEQPNWQLNVSDGQVIDSVDVNGVTGVYVEQFGKATPAGGIDFSARACGAPPEGCGFWQSELRWEFAPGSWATIYGIAGESLPPQAAIRPTFLAVAEALRAGGGLSTRVPFRVGTDPGPLPSLMESGVGLAPVDNPGGGWLASFHGEPTLEFSVNSTLCSPDAEEPESTVERFTYRGHTGCLRFYEGELSGVGLRIDGVDRGIWNLYTNDDMDAADLKRWLADLTVAPLDDPSTWFDLRSAFGD